MFMGKRWPSFIHHKDRLLAYVAMMIIIAVIVVFAVIMGVLIQQKIQMSNTISDQQDNSPATLNSGSDGQTNMLAPVPPPPVSVTNSN